MSLTSCHGYKSDLIAEVLEAAGIALGDNKRACSRPRVPNASVHWAVMPRQLEPV